MACGAFAAVGVAVGGRTVESALDRLTGRIVSRRPRPHAAWNIQACDSTEGSSKDTTWATSPASLTRAWRAARHEASTTDLAQRHVSVLVVSWRCERALLGERVFAQHAARRSRARRLLVHSAGLEVEAGAALPRSVLAFAASRGLDISESQPCARFDGGSDFEFYDLLLAVDRSVRDRLYTLAECAAHARHARGDVADLADWERKIKLLADLDVDEDAKHPYLQSNIKDVPELNHDPDRAFEVLNGASERALNTLIARGL